MTSTVNIDPFTSLGEYFIAINVIKQHFSSKTKNYECVANLINSQLKNRIGLSKIMQFVDHLIMYPNETGYNCFQSLNLYKDQSDKPIFSDHIVLTPSVDKCVFCKEKLTIKKISLFKEPILYRNEGIGTVILFIPGY